MAQLEKNGGKKLVTFFLTSNASNLPLPNLNISFAVLSSNCVVAFTEGASLPVGQLGLTV